MSKTEELKDDQEKPGSLSTTHPFIFINPIADFVTYIMIIGVGYGSIYMFYNVDQLMEPIIKLDTGKDFPSYKDLLPSLLYFAILVALHHLLVWMFADRVAKYLTPRYYQENDQVLIDIYKKKVCTGFFKFCCYLASSIFGYYILANLDYYPTSLYGQGEFKNLFIGGHKQYFFYTKPEHFDLYYNWNLAFALFDGWLLLTHPLQSDFLFMTLHHLATYSLIVFSYITNWSGVGIIVYFIHYFGDVFSYIVRIVVHLNVPQSIPAISTLVFLIVFIYTRLYVYGDVVYQVYANIDRWTCIEHSLTSFLVILMTLNILWIVLITRKFVLFLKTGNIEEIYKFKLSKNKQR